MTLQTSGAISLSQLKNEFGGPGSPNLGSYYRGGSFNVNASTNVPTSGAISLSMFYGLSKIYDVTSSALVVVMSYYKKTMFSHQELWVNGTPTKNLTTGTDDHYSISDYVTVDKVANLPIVNINEKTFTAGQYDFYTIYDGSTKALMIEVSSGFMRVYIYDGYSIVPTTTDPSTGARYGTFAKVLTFIYKDSSGRTATKDITVQLNYYS